MFEVFLKECDFQLENSFAVEVLRAREKFSTKLDLVIVQLVENLSNAN